MSMTPSQIAAQIQIFASSAVPFLQPKAQLAVTLATNAMNAIQIAQNGGADVTDAQLDALFAADDQAKADDLKAQLEVMSKA